MRKERTLLGLGIWVAVLPFLGFPNIWREVLFVCTGGALIALAILFYNQAKSRLSKNDTRSKTFVDNIGSGE